MAQIVKRINAIAIEPTRTIQFYDGYNPHIFYDLGDYIASICSDEKLLNEFHEQLAKVIPYKAHTDYVYVYGFGTVWVEYYSGISTSAPSTSAKCASYEETEWAKRTL